MRLIIALRVAAGDYRTYNENYKLGGLEGIPKYAEDYSTLLTLGQTGNLAATYLGSYKLNYSVASVDIDNGSAELIFQVQNETTLGSLLHPPYIGYTKFWENNITPFVNSLVPTGPMSKVTQNFWWIETIYYK